MLRRLVFSKQQQPLPTTLVTEPAASHDDVISSSSSDHMSLRRKIKKIKKTKKNKARSSSQKDKKQTTIARLPVVVVMVMLILCLRVVYRELFLILTDQQQQESSLGYEAYLFETATPPESRVNTKEYYAKKNRHVKTKSHYFYPKQQFFYDVDTNEMTPVKNIMEQDERLQVLPPPNVIISDSISTTNNINNNASPLEKSSESSSDCQPMKAWQTTSLFSTCNTAHEINARPETGSMEYLGCGGDRCAFVLKNNNNDNDNNNNNDDDDDNVVLKIPRFKKSIEKQSYIKARQDTISMERLQHSDYIINIYGSCGLSQIIEKADDGGHMPDLVKTMRAIEKKKNRQNHYLDQLKILYHIAGAVADMHSFEKDGSVSLVHEDIDIYQFLLVKGIYKLNDFHLARFQTVNTKTNETCPLIPAYVQWPDHKLIRSPEEIAHWGSPQMLEKTDVYTMGNVMYYVLTADWLFPRVPVRQAVQQVKDGRRSPWPKSLLANKSSNNDDDDAAIMIAIMKTAIEMCWTHVPEERPKAIEVRDYLATQLKLLLNIKEGQALTVDDVRIQPSLRSFLVKYQASDDAGYDNMLG